MNLIEQLGGYERASEDFKKLHLNLKEQQKSNKVFMDAFDALKTELLEYRRQHNIFEVGDKVFYTGRANDNDLYTIKEIYIGHDFVVGDNGADKNFWTLFLEEIRHATDEEIKAGKRLEVK